MSKAVVTGEPIIAKLTTASGNDEPIGGLKVMTANGWFAVRPSGTENIYKLYAKSFQSEAHQNVIVAEAREIVRKALMKAGQK
jgi:phosphoglucomutase